MSFWLTSDTHLGHANVIEYDRRPFKSLEEMDAELIRRWNTVVDHGDTVYHLGDVILCHSHQAEAYFAQLNGKIKIVPGGHDHGWMRYMRRVGRVFESRSHHPIEILPPLTEICLQWAQKRAEVVVCHYPLLTWEGEHYGSWHCYGHSHGRRNGYHPRAVDVGCMNHNFVPISPERLEEIIDVRSRQWGLIE